MQKNYTLSTLLKNAASKEDVEHQAINIEKVCHPDAANRVYEQKKTCHPFKKFSRPATESGKKKHRESAGEKPKQSASESHNQNPRKKNCCCCGMSHPGPCSNVQHQNKHAITAPRRVTSLLCVRREDNKCFMGDEPPHDTDSDNSDFVFSVKTGKKRPTVAVMINGIKGHMEADSGASANIMDKEQFHKWSQQGTDSIDACQQPSVRIPSVCIRH